MPSRSQALRDLAFALCLLVLLLLFFWPVAAGQYTMLPADVLFRIGPWKAHTGGSAAAVPHNALVTDLLLENYVWKRFILECVRQRQLPLWNPYILAGVPFLAAGQHSALYPFSAIFFLVPLPRAYGLFTISQLLVAGLCMYFFARTLRLSRLAAAAGGLIFTFSGFFLVSTVFPMILATAAWLPFLLAIVEHLVRSACEAEMLPLRQRLRAPLPWVILGSVALGMLLLAGHVEFFYYTLLIVGAYVVYRSVCAFYPHRRWRALGAFCGALSLVLALGFGLGAIQVIPLFETVTRNFREGSATYEQIVGWAFPPRQVLTFLIPDFFGNPTHHGYVDLYTGEWVSSWRNAFGEVQDTVFWGVKNYVEAGSYVSILGLLLAILGVASRPRGRAWFFAGLALFSLTLVFGMPTYRLLYALPGIKQLHSPFRWVFAYTVCTSVLAAFGVQMIVEAIRDNRKQHLATALGATGVILGLGSAAAVAALRLWPEKLLPLADQAVQRLALAAQSFSDGRMFASYQARNLLLFGACTLAAGAIMLAPRWLRPRVPLHRQVWPYALLAALALDPACWLRSFSAAADPAILEIRPTAIQYLQQQAGPFRITVYDTRDAKPLPANTNMLFGLQDVRGYDSIIPKTYAEVMKLVGPQELEYNQIARLRQAESLGSPILDLLNVQYVLTEEQIDRPDYTLVHESDLKVYRREKALPRAFVVFQIRSYASRQELLDALPTADPAHTALLEEPVSNWQPPRGDPAPPPVEIMHYGANEIRLRVDMPESGWLILADNHFPGWVAYTTLEGSSREQALTIYRADGTVRAVQLGPGLQTVRFKYAPGSFKTGLFLSFMSTVSLMLLAGLWFWLGAYTQATGEGDTAKRVAKNTVAPLIMQLVNKAIDTAFAMLVLRLLGPDNQGKYYFAIYVALLFEALINFGLNTLVTREVACRREQANRYLWNTSILRLGLAGASAPLLAGFLLLWRPMPTDTALAIVLLAIGLIPSSLSAGVSAVFMAFEVMEIPAVITTVTTILKVGLSTGALLLGFGFVGLAGVSIVVNVLTLVLLLGLMRRLLFRPRPEPASTLQRHLLGEAFPLMLNHLLATLFFKVDVTLLQRLAGDAVLGMYSVAYKLIDAVGIIPPTFTMALFPLMSRLASSSREALLRAYILSVKLLLATALLVALLTTALAYPLTAILGGSAYLPDSAIALQIIVWYMPLGFINSVTQYLLIALGRQRYLTGAYAIGLAFSLGANLLLIPRFGYRSAAAVHILAELALLIPFYIGVRRYLAPVPWVRIVWRPAVAATAGAVPLWLMGDQSRWLAALLSASLYTALLLGLGTFDVQDRALLLQVLPLQQLLSRMRRLAARAG
ncbi:MAG: oligosaccharide flippase family protein [Anaerolineae bacterium]